MNKKYLNGFKPFIDDGVESVRFYNDDLFLKIINKEYLKDDRKEIVEKLFYFDNENIVKPIFGLKDKTGFIGYGMNFLKNYDYIDCITMDSTSFNERKKLMLKLSKTFDYFDDNLYAYYDIHEKNILCKDENIKLVDLDSGVFKGYTNSKMTYELAIRVSKKRLSRFIISFLYNTNPDDFYDNLKNLTTRDNKMIKGIFPFNINELYEYSINNDFHVISGISECINDFDEEMYYKTNDVIKRRLIK